MLVATFERLSALLASPDLHLGRIVIVIDAVDLLSEESRGPMFSASARQSQWMAVAGCQSQAIVVHVVAAATIQRMKMAISAHFRGRQPRSAEGICRSTENNSFTERIKSRTSQCYERGREMPRAESPYPVPCLLWRISDPCATKFTNHGEVTVNLGSHC